MPNRNDQQEDTIFRILQLLETTPQISQRELADELGISLGRINYCLSALVDKGFVKLENFQNAKNKLKYAYILTPAGIAQKLAITRRFLKRKMDEYEALKIEIESLRTHLDTANVVARSEHQA